MKPVKSTISLMKKFINKTVEFILLFAINSSIYAATTSIDETYSWDYPIKMIGEELTSNLATGVAIIAIAVSGLMLMFVDLQKGGKNVAKSVIGLSICLGATGIIKNMAASGALIF